VYLEYLKNTEEGACVYMHLWFDDKLFSDQLVIQGSSWIVQTSGCSYKMGWKCRAGRGVRQVVITLCGCCSSGLWRRVDLWADTNFSGESTITETLVSTHKSTRRYNPEEQHRHLHRPENLKSHEKTVGLLCCTEMCAGILFYTLNIIVIRRAIFERLGLWSIEFWFSRKNTSVK
jgi:hypothetical protein